MPDKRCPNCGLWNSQQAILCDCGFDFDTGVIRGASSFPQPAAATSLLKAALYGALGSLLAIFPVSIVKTIYFWFGSGLCRHLILYDPQLPIALTPCGITLFSLRSIPLWIYFLSILIGGALLSTLMVFVFRRVIIAKSPYPTLRRSTPIFWPAFSTGILFDVILVFIVLYPGQ